MAFGSFSLEVKKDGEGSIQMLFPIYHLLIY